MSAGVRALCNSLSSKLVQCWNRRSAVEQELAHHDVAPERRADLEARLVLAAMADGKA